MSVAGRHKTFMAPFHTLISCDIPFVLFRLDLEHDMSQRILLRAPIHFVTSEYFSLDYIRHVTASPGGFRLTALLLISFLFLEKCKEQFITGRAVLHYTVEHSK